MPRKRTPTAILRERGSWRAAARAKTEPVPPEGQGALPVLAPRQSEAPVAATRATVERDAGFDAGGRSGAGTLLPALGPLARS